jgi:hypothetical protein
MNKKFAKQFAMNFFLRASKEDAEDVQQCPAVAK